jgi:hypothetical protein
MSLFLAVCHPEIPENTASHPAHNRYASVTTFRVHYPDLQQSAFIGILIDQIIGPIRNTYEQVYNMLNSLIVIRNISYYLLCSCIQSIGSINSGVMMCKGLFNPVLMNSILSEILKKNKTTQVSKYLFS